MIIVFDLGRVIVDFDLSKVSRTLAAVSGAREPDIISFMFENDLSRAHDLGTITGKDFFESLRRKFNFPLTFEQFMPIWNEIFTLIPGMEELITKLKASYRVGLLSNTNKLHFDYIAETYPVIRGMDWFLSCDLHLMKPDQAIYRKVADFYRVPPSEIFFTDDMRQNIVGAQQAGMHAVQFQSPDQLRSELTGCGITV